MTDLMHKTTSFIRRSMTLKMVTIAILILLLLIPTSMVTNLIRERENRRDEVVADITGKWGAEQTLTGPYLTVPYRVHYTNQEGQQQYTLHHLHLLPESLSTSGQLETEVRYRSLFEAVVYKVDIQGHGEFLVPELERLNIAGNDILWDKATLALGISDMRGIREKVILKFNQQDYAAQPGLVTDDLAKSGISAQIDDLQPGGRYAFSYNLDLNGSQELNFMPLAEINHVNLQADWPSPSFAGAFLPVQRELSDSGFKSTWKILHLNRNYPQFWSDSYYGINSSVFGARLLLTADIYQKSMRLAKYSIMFLIFTFAAFFLAEVINRQGIHPIQYLLIGVAVLIFYTLVLSLSEYINFNLAYILSAAAVTLLIAGYGRTIVVNSRFGFFIGGLLGLLYSYLFLILQLEDYALVLGSIGLFIIVAAVMYLTRKIDWYDVDNNS